jgi:hypothetical protein
MSIESARVLIDRKLKDLQKLAYQDLLDLMQKRHSTNMAIGPDGEKYQTEVQCLWDSKKGGDIRVMVSVDGGGVSAFRPLSGSFIIRPDGSFVGEDLGLAASLRNPDA